MAITRDIGILLLSVFLILWGLAQLVPGFSGLGLILAILAILAGIALLVRR